MKGLVRTQSQHDYFRDTLGLIGDSAPMLELRETITRTASADVPVLVQGENGTGKELVARALHDLSLRRLERFVAMNCAAVPGDLLESELFGHEKGAFSGAIRDRVGRLEQAHRGTLFLDEIGDMPLMMQAKLLRVLQDGEVTKLGSDGGVSRVDVRIVAATNKDLAAMIDAGTFREDLYFRIAAVVVKLPALRDRLDDVPALVAHFLPIAKAKGPRRPFTDEAVELLKARLWHGNVRELQHVVERALILTPGTGEIGADALAKVLPAVKEKAPKPVHVCPTPEPHVCPTPEPHVCPAPPAHAPTLDEAAKSIGSTLAEAVTAFERAVIVARLQAHGYNVTATAASLQLERLHLYKTCRRLGIEIPALLSKAGRGRTVLRVGAEA